MEPKQDAGGEQKGVPEPRWPAAVAIGVTGLIYASLPEYLAVRPRWLLFGLLIGLEIPAIFFHRRGYPVQNRWIGYLASGLLTGFVMWSLGVLIFHLPKHEVAPVELLRGAAALWVSNVFNFALWYWRLDGGGPTERDRRAGHTEGAFLFPQMTWGPTKGKWSPGFFDYLFVAFNTSTAFSPTDTAVLSRWAKGLVMLQAAISLTVFAILIGRAVNIM